ncbi:MAG: exo-beta-N-acetylmuramidase NamZ domain-containing protein [Flavobacteriaceae bacterium]
MAFLSGFKNTVFLWLLILSSCGNEVKKDSSTASSDTLLELKKDSSIIVAANRTQEYLPHLRDKSIAIVANQTSVIFKDTGDKNQEPRQYTHLVDSLVSLKMDIKQVFAPEHGFRGKADAGEHVTDGVDSKTGLPIISLYGKNRKPSQEQLEGLDLVVFDIQDVGVRFYTYIATLQLVMEACAEKGIDIMVLDRPNPNGHYVDGPTMEEEHTGFLGMILIPLVYGMTIGEYATMINEEGWLTDGIMANLTVVPLKHYTHKMNYKLPIRPSPNLPSDTAINLYPSLGLFEGTNINAGRGTEFQFQRYGAPFLNEDQYDFSYTPEPNFGSKNPKHKGKLCFGKDLSKTPRMKEMSLRWILDAYENSGDKSLFFNTKGFTRHAGTAKLQKKIESGLTEAEIKDSWQKDLERFKKIRTKYLLYE